MTSASHQPQLLALSTKPIPISIECIAPVGPHPPQFKSERAHKVIACKYHGARNNINVHPQKTTPSTQTKSSIQYTLPPDSCCSPNGKCFGQRFVRWLYNGKCYNDFRKKNIPYIQITCRPTANIQLKANNIHFAHETNISISFSARLRSWRPFSLSSIFLDVCMIAVRRSARTFKRRSRLQDSCRHTNDEDIYLFIYTFI